MSRSESHAQNIDFVSNKWEAVNNHVMGIRQIKTRFAGKPYRAVFYDPREDNENISKDFVPFDISKLTMKSDSS
ncbi:Oidioi.mRNA.OKI2018_I69.chr2.g6429.t1.cds [Oikopleura dioica]|uniref:Oidioi.mRNA.OKI2018_I69.chr2.g6429.t1.cds n=1 Tax=Oikopleura dioica TaxID=34765 RepID=A0ABN7T956_OIKDI|nr:Oidioi.mRNA.OKI2018_I69.chr2.g6429.t1.cds [Oikopleura dioica]